MEKKVCQQYCETVVVALCFLIIVFCDFGAFICIDKPIRPIMGLNYRVWVLYNCMPGLGWGGGGVRVEWKENCLFS